MVENNKESTGNLGLFTLKVNIWTCIVSGCDPPSNKDVTLATFQWLCLWYIKMLKGNTTTPDFEHI